MRADQVLVADLAAALVLVALVGIAARGRARLCWSFVAYLIAVLVGNRLTTWWPEVFYTHGAWMVRSTTYTVLTGLVAVEIAILTFAVAPRARRRAVGAMAVIVAVAAANSAWAARSSTVLWVLAPRGETAVLWMMTVIIGLAAWHRFPLHPYHRAILVGRTLYLTFDVVLLGLLAGRAHSEPAFQRFYTYAAALDPSVFAASLGLWAWAAWRPVERRTGVIAQLQPWAA